MTARAPSIKKIRDWAAQGDLRSLDSETLAEVKQALSDHRIELAEIPSEAPGVPGHPGSSPKQLAIQEAFFSRAYRIVAADGANRSGKTFTVGGLCFCKHLRDEAKDGDVYWVVSQSTGTMRDIPHKILWDFLPRAMFPEGLEYNPKLGFGQIPTLHLTLPGDRGKAEVWFKTEEMHLKAFESSAVHGVWWTEVTRESIFFSIQPRLASTGGWLLLDYVPTEGWHRLRIKDAAASGINPYIYHVRFGMIDNAHNMPEGEIEYQRSQMSKEEAAVRIDGKDAAAFGVVYKQLDPDRHVVPSFAIPPDWPRWRTMDYGYRNPTACLWVAAIPPGFVLPDGRPMETGGLVVYREYYQTEKPVKENARAVLDLSQGETFQGPAIMDPTTTQITQANGKSIADAYRDAGLPVRPGIRVNQYGERAMVEGVRKLLDHDQLIFLDTCPWTIYEHRSWRYKENAEGEAPGKEPFADKLNHTCDALKILVAENPRFSHGYQGEVDDIPEEALW